MPVYEYLCRDCGKILEVRQTLAEKEKEDRHSCPACGSSNMAQYYGNMTVIASTHLH